MGIGDIGSASLPTPPRHGRPDTAVTIIRPPGRWPGLGLTELWRYRSICLVLARRNLKVRYRQTVIGAGWTLLQPLLLMVAFTTFFGLLARLPAEGLPYPVFFLLGLLPYMMVSKILTEGSTSVVANSALVTRIYIPRIYLPTAIAIPSLVDLGFGLAALAVVLAVFGIVPGVGLLLLPVLVVVAVAAGLGMSYWLSALNVTYRDVAQLLPFLSQVLMFSSPVIYSITLIPEAYRPLYYVNPMALVVTGFRWAFAGTSAPPLEAWILGVGMAALLLVTGYVFFRYREHTFSDVI